MPLTTSEITQRVSIRTRSSILIGGVVVALGALLGTGITVQVSAAEQQERVAAAERASADQAAAELKAATRDEDITRAAQERLASEAQAAIAAATPVIAAADGKADASSLESPVISLAQHGELEPIAVLGLVDSVESAIPAVQAAVVDAERRAAEAAAARAAALVTPAGAQAYARDLMASSYGWGADQASCLVNLWQKESGWRYDARNPSGATGIPQSLPGSKMASHGADWQTNPATQISWGLEYIERAYGSPCGAWGHSQSHNWY